MPESHPQHRLTAREGAALVKAWHRHRPSECQASFCRRRKIGPWVLRYWLDRLAPKSRPGFVQVAAQLRAPFLDVSIGAAQIRLHTDFDPDLFRAVASCLSVGDSSC